MGLVEKAAVKETPYIKVCGIENLANAVHLFLNFKIYQGLFVHGVGYVGFIGVAHEGMRAVERCGRLVDEDPRHSFGSAVVHMRTII